MSTQVEKKNRVLPIAVSDCDLTDLHEIRKKIVFPPSRSALALGILRAGIRSVKLNKLSLRTISSMISSEAIESRFSEETGPDVITVTCLFCREKFIYSTQGVKRSEIERDKREHVCKGAK